MDTRNLCSMLRAGTIRFILSGDRVFDNFYSTLRAGSIRFIFYVKTEYFYSTLRAGSIKFIFCVETGIYSPLQAGSINLYPVWRPGIPASR